MEEQDEAENLEASCECNRKSNETRESGKDDNMKY